MSLQGAAHEEGYLPEWLQECCAALRSNENEPQLNLMGKSMDNAFMMRSFVSALRGNSTLVDLDLSFNVRYNPKLLELFSDGILHDHPSLRILWLLNNGLDDGVAVNLANALTSKACRLTNLHLDGNDIGDVGAVALARALKHNTTLEWLSLSCNRLTDVAAIALADSLRCNTALVVLRLGSNHLTCEGATALREALEQSTCALQILRIGGGTENDALHGQYDRLCRDNQLIRYEYEEIQRDLRGHRSLQFPRSRWPQALASVDTKPDFCYSLLRSHPAML